MNSRPRTTATYRAGMNLKDATRSGYARVCVLDKQDLFPNEGYDFPENRHKPPTNSYRISEDSPFNNSFEHSSAWREPEPESIRKGMDTMLQTEKLCNHVAAKAISTPTDGELRPLYSKIAFQAIQKDRQAQVAMREQMKMQQMKEDAYWADIEQEQGLQTRRVQQKYANTIHDQQRKLANDYQQQFALHRKRIEAEKEESRREAQKIREIQKNEEKQELKRQERLRQIAAERAKEFTIRNEELLQRRAKRIEDDLAQEAITIRQHAESEKRMEERANFEKRRREEKNRIREKLISDQSKRLAEIKAREQHFQTTAESEISKREEADRKKRLDEQKRLSQQRQKDYADYLREKDLKMMNKKETPDWTNDDDEEARQFDAKMRDLQQKRLRRDQMRQITERRERERRERMEEIAHARKKDTMYFLKDDDEW